MRLSAMRLVAPFASSLVLAVLLAACTAAPRPAAPVLVVEAGAYDRRATPVAFDAAGLAPGAYRLVDEAGAVLPAQVDAAGRGALVLDRLDAGAARRFRVVPGAAPAPGVTVAAAAGAYTYRVDGEEVLVYRHAPAPLPPGVDPLYRRGGFVHPVRTPSGAVVTDMYPNNHRHQQGIWSAWTNTVFEGRKPDFWNMGQGRGRVEPVDVDAVWSGPVQGGVAARHRFVDLTAPTPRAALDEQWTLRAWAAPPPERPARVFDLEVVQTTASDAPLELPEYHYGGVGFRGPWAWNGAENTVFLTSEGRTRADGHGTRARWAYVGGQVDGRPAGVAILGHPDNYRAPQPMRIHPDEPFFNFAPSQLGAFRIEPGVPYRARYRYVAFDGPPDADLIERMWRDYAAPPAARLVR